VPLGDGLLCWVDRWRYRGRGVIFSDMLDESPELRYVPVPYPAEAVNYRCFLCTNALGALKLVSLSPGRCSHCGCSQHATAVNTWAQKTDDMDWVLETETMVDSTDELWALESRNHGGSGLRTRPPGLPCCEYEGWWPSCCYRRELCTN
jgi:hypothetical protein